MDVLSAGFGHKLGGIVCLAFFDPALSNHCQILESNHYTISRTFKYPLNTFSPTGT
jgi:hypothetical protein